MNPLEKAKQDLADAAIEFARGPQIGPVYSQHQHKLETAALAYAYHVGKGAVSIGRKLFESLLTPKEPK